jgi:hypothetical protein
MIICVRCFGISSASNTFAAVARMICMVVLKSSMGGVPGGPIGVSAICCAVWNVFIARRSFALCDSMLGSQVKVTSISSRMAM